MLVLATLWPQFWDGLTARPAGGADPHAQARELLAGHDITVPAAFTAAQLQRLSRGGGRAAGPGRRRGAGRAGHPVPGRGARAAGPVPQRAARRGGADPRGDGCPPPGHGIGLPQAFLEAAAPGYLTDTEWDALGEDWLEQALAYTAVPCKGVRGPLTRIRPRPARSRAPGPGSGDSDEQLAGMPPRAGRCTGSRITWISTAGPPEGPVPPGRLLGRGGRPRLPRRPGRAR